MIPEIGQISLILALCMAIALAVIPVVGAQRGIASWVAVARPAAWGQLLFMLTAYGCLTYAFLTHDFSVAYVAHNSNVDLPLIYRVSGVWGAHEGSLLLWALTLSAWTAAVGAVQPQRPGGDGRARPRRHGAGEHRLPAVHAPDLQPLRPPHPVARAGPRPQPAAAGPGPRDPPADALHGLRRLCGALRLRDRGDARRPARRRLGALVATLDQCRLGLPDAGHRARLLVGLLRAGLGRLVVLGPGRERVVHALAGGHRAHALAGRDREARRLQGLDRAAGDLRLLAQPARHLPRPLGRAHLGARLRQRPDARRVHPALPLRGHRRLAAALCLARGADPQPGGVRAAVARNRAAAQQRRARRRRRERAAGHAVSPGHRRPGPGQAFGRPAVLQRRVSAADEPAAGAGRHRRLPALEGGPVRARAQGVHAAADRRGGAGCAVSLLMERYEVARRHRHDPRVLGRAQPDPDRCASGCRADARLPACLLGSGA